MRKDHITPFQLERSAVRGRLVRLEKSLESIIEWRTYPPIVQKTLADFLVITVALASTLKYKGVFTLQAKGDGPIRIMIADFTHDGHLRGYAQFDEKILKSMDQALLEKEGVMALFGKGLLAFTVDQGIYAERYQSIVGLLYPSLAECINHYFEQSEQLRTFIKVLTEKSKKGHWHGTGLMIQALPLVLKGMDLQEDNWERAYILCNSVTPKEMISQTLSDEEVIFRLFHEETPRIYEKHPFLAQCRCSRERIYRILKSFSEKDIRPHKG